MVAIESLNLYNVAPSAFIAANEDIFAGDPASDVVSMANYQDIVFIIAKNAGATGTATITVESCDDVTPTTTTAVAFRQRATTAVGNSPAAWAAVAAAGFATTAGADQSYLIWVKAEDLDGTDQFVRLQTVEVVDSPCDGAIVAIALNPRFEFDGAIDITS